MPEEGGGGVWPLGPRWWKKYVQLLSVVYSRREGGESPAWPLEAEPKKFSLSVIYTTGGREGGPGARLVFEKLMIFQLAFRTCVQAVRNPDADGPEPQSLWAPSAPSR